MLHIFVYNKQPFKVPPSPLYLLTGNFRIKSPPASGAWRRRASPGMRPEHPLECLVFELSGWPERPGQAPPNPPGSQASPTHHANPSGSSRSLILPSTGGAHTICTQGALHDDGQAGSQRTPAGAVPTPNTTHPRWITAPNVRAKTIKLSAESTGANPCDLRSHKAFLDMTPEAPAKENRPTGLHQNQKLLGISWWSSGKDAALSLPGPGLISGWGTKIQQATGHRKTTATTKNKNQKPIVL